MMPVISVSTFDTVEIKEDQKTEFKRSIFIDPETQTPGAKQMRTIAETIAAFMNAEGGMLYVGISDDKNIIGIDDDLNILANQAASVVARSPRANDDGYTYGATADKYELKIRAIVKAYLSANARDYLGSVLVRTMGTKDVCRIECKPCKPDEFVYAYRKYGPSKPEVAEIYVRTGNQKNKLEGEARDAFVRKRVNAGFSAQLETVRMAAAQAGDTRGYAAVVESVKGLLDRLDGRRLEGATVAVTGGHPFSEEAVTAAKKPRSLAWDGAHYTDVSSWQDLVLKVLEKLQELNAAKFDELAQSNLKRYFVVIQRPRERHTDCFPTRFGADGKVRVKKSLGNKVYLWKTDMALRKIIDAFGVDVSKFMFVAG